MKQIVIIAAILLVVNLQGTATGASTTAWSPVTLKIEHTWLRRSADGLQLVTGSSLGTAVGPNLILTHGHFRVPLQSPRSVTLRVIDSAGRVSQYRNAEVQPIILGRETTFIYLPSDLAGTGAPLADGATLNGLAPGEWVTVNYWDDVQQRGAQRSFQITQVRPEVVILADPDHVINVGDSGGGVFHADQLIGITSSIDVDAHDRPAGCVNVILTTPGFRNLVQQYNALPR